MSDPSDPNPPTELLATGYQMNMGRIHALDRSVRGRALCGFGPVNNWETWMGVFKDIECRKCSRRAVEEFGL